MAKPEWGVKRTCAACAARFYDFSKRPILCPSCGAEFLPDAALKPRRTRAAPAAASKPAPPPPEPDTEPKAPSEETGSSEDELAAIETTDGDGDADTNNDADDDSVIQDTTDLGGEDDGGLGEAGVKVTESGDT